MHVIGLRTYDYLVFIRFRCTTCRRIVCKLIYVVHLMQIDLLRICWGPVVQLFVQIYNKSIKYLRLQCFYARTQIARRVERHMFWFESIRIHVRRQSLRVPGIVYLFSTCNDFTLWLTCVWVWTVPLRKTGTFLDTCEATLCTLFDACRSTNCSTCG